MLVNTMGMSDVYLQVDDLNLSVDQETDVAYLTLGLGTIVQTVQFGRVNLDLDADGNALGVEILSLRDGSQRDET